ncbi:MAG: hypothetical protein IT515_18435 [Burkholderiales bacterium]|nr:hypothetical protein [Burkholderiales bacterium]
MTGVNYDKLVEDERDRILVKPHFRMNPETPHSVGCEWVARERAEEAADARDREPAQRRGMRSFRNLKSSDFVDVFLPAQLARGPPCESAESSRTSGAGREPTAADPVSTRTRAGRSKLTRVDFLETVVSAYELLEADERREAKLRIGREASLPYNRAFCRVERYFLARGARIFHGGVRVQAHGPNFSVRFFDRVIVPAPMRPGEARELVLYLKREALLQHWNGRFLTLQLAEATKPGHYAHCYFFGRVVDHPTLAERLAVEVRSLEHLAFTVRRRAIASKRATTSELISY